jgi:hypothetical protein
MKKKPLMVRKRRLSREEKCGIAVLLLTLSLYRKFAERVFLCSHSGVRASTKRRK